MSEGALSVTLEDVAFAYPGGEFRLEVPELVVTAGARVACIGPSGCGKSTLVNLIAGILLPERGRIRLGDLAVSTASEAERRAIRIRSIGMVFQELELLEHLSALDNLLLPFHINRALRLDDAARGRARELAASMGISHVLDRDPRRLSGGERQRLAICRALVTNPGLLMCDEPTGSLDPRNAAHTLDLLFTQAADHAATLFVVTHDHGLLARFDQVIDMGALVGGGT